jgi:site-specific DNA recombinase
MKIAAIYVRVSTEDQEREGTSLGSQKEACLKYATEQGYEVQDAYVIEEVYSGLTLDRPKLTQLREWVKDKEIDAAIIYSTDRLSRDPLHLLLLADEFDKAGIKLCFVTEPSDNSMEGQLLNFVRGWSSKLEALRLKERTTRGKRTWAKEGKYPGGRTAYGYKLVDGKQEIESEEAEVIQMIFDWLVKKGLSLYAIQLRMNKLGIPTREGKSWWRRNIISRIVRDPIYTGNWFYNKRMKAPAKTKEGIVQVLRPVEQWIPVKVPPIISEETFEAAQRQLARNKELSQRNIHREYLLSGLLVCGRCGHHLNARTSSKGTIYYLCNSKQFASSRYFCDSRYVRGDNLEAVVWENVSRLLTQPDLIVEQMKKSNRDNPTAYLETSLDRICRALARKKLETDRMLDAYKIGAIDLQTLKQKMDEIKEEQRNLEGEKLNLEKELRKAQAQELNEEKLYEFCQNLPMTLTNLSFEDKRQILREVVDRIVVDGNEITIYGIIPMPDDKGKNVSVELPSPWL